MMYSLIFVMCLIALDMVSAIFVNCIIKKEPFQSSKIKKGLIEKGLELALIFTLNFGAGTELAPIIKECHLDTFTLTLFAIQEGVSVYENFKKMKEGK